MGKEEKVYHFKDSAVTRKLGKGDYRCLFCSETRILDCVMKENSGILPTFYSGIDIGILGTRNAIDEYRTRLRQAGLKDDIFGNCISKLCTREHMDIQDYSIYKE
jgi:hypothetical protein